MARIQLILQTTEEVEAAIKKGLPAERPVRTIAVREIVGI